MHDLTGLGRNVVDTTNTDDKDQLGFVRDVVVALSTSLATEFDLLTFGLAVLSIVRFGALCNKLTLLLLSLNITVNTVEIL